MSVHTRYRDMGVTNEDPLHTNLEQAQLIAVEVYTQYSDKEVKPIEVVIYKDRIELFFWHTEVFRSRDEVHG